MGVGARKREWSEPRPQQLCRLALRAMTQYALSGRTGGLLDPKGYWVMA